MLKRASRMSLADARIVVRRVKPVDLRPIKVEAALAVVAIMTGAIDRCTVPYAALVAKRHKFLSNQPAASLFIALIASNRDERVVTREVAKASAST